MKISYEGIGQWAATFACDNAVAGQVVKVSENAKVSGCADGEHFGGVVLSVSRDGTACSVAMGGMQTVSCSGGVVPGWNNLSADGNGGVKSDENGKSYLVVNVNDSEQTVTFVM